MVENDEDELEEKKLKIVERITNVISVLVVIVGIAFLIYIFFIDRSASLSNTIQAYAKEEDYPVYSGRNVNEYWRSTLDENLQILYDEMKEGYLQFVTEFATEATDITLDDMTKVYGYIMLDHPEIFWISSFGGMYKYFDRESINTNKTIILTYSYSEEEAIEIKNRIEPTYQAIIDGALEQENDYQKIKYVHDELINISTNVGDYTEDEKQLYQSIISIFDTGNTVCAGFGYGFKFIMDNLGIESLATWNADNEALDEDADNHIWNMVKLYGTWYNLDVTWDNDITVELNEEGTIAYNYFLKTNDEFYTSHLMQDGIPE